MAISLSGGFALSGTSDPNFSRDRYDHITDMSAVTVMDTGHIVYCVDTGKHYVYVGSGGNVASNKFKELSSGNRFFNGTVDQISSVQISITLPTGYEITNGDLISISSSNNNYISITSSNANLSINGGTTKAIYYKGAAIGANTSFGCDILLVQYDGTRWNIISMIVLPDSSLSQTSNNSVKSSGIYNSIYQYTSSTRNGYNHPVPSFSNPTVNNHYYIKMTSASTSDTTVNRIIGIEVYSYDGTTYTKATWIAGDILHIMYQEYQNNDSTAHRFILLDKSTTIYESMGNLSNILGDINTILSSIVGE